MIVFITSIRHPQNSSDYKKVEELLERTLRSVCNQNNHDYRVVVVCNRIPCFPVPQNVCYVKVDFPPPSKSKVAKTSIPAVLKDKGTKCYIGLLKALEFNPDYIMFFDADDFIHQRIADYANSNRGENGWYINKGYVYRDGGLLLSNVKNFNRFCGTSNIINPRLFKLNLGLTVSSSQTEILNTVDNEFLFRIFGDHQAAEYWFDEKYHSPLKPFPFYAGIWVAETGENHSGVRFFGRPEFIKREVVTDFNLTLPRSYLLMLTTIVFYYPYANIRALLRIIKHRCFL